MYNTFMIYDLNARTIKFSKDLISFLRGCKSDMVNRPIIDQLVRSGTSIGANYSEANGAVSRKDFRNKIHICKKEAQESKYWLELIDAPESTKIERDRLKKEVEELIKIFAKIASSSK